MKVHELIARTVAEEAVDTVFGVMGDANIHLVDNLVNQHAMRYVKASHEAGAVLMASGYAQVMGCVGVATTTCGPGLTNALTALTEVARSHTPLVVLVGDTSPTYPTNPHNVDHEAFVRPTEALFIRIAAASTAAGDVATAFRRARQERRPVVLDIPVDVQALEVDNVFAVGGTRRPTVEVGTPVPHARAMNDAVGILASARRPIILAGRGAVLAGARRALVDLGQRLGAPMATTLRAKDLFRGEDFDLGICGSFSNGVGGAIISEADCILAFGAGLNEWTTDHARVVAGKSIVHVDSDPLVIGRYSAVDAAVVGDVLSAAVTIGDYLDEAEIAASSWRSPAMLDRLRSHDPLTERRDTDGDATVDANVVSVYLDRLLPYERTYVCDAGRFMQAVLPVLHASGPEAFVHTTDFGSIGLGLATAIGAAIASPTRCTVLTIGDGGLMMSLGELAQVGVLGLDLIVVLYDNGAYGAEVTTAIREGWMDPTLSMMAWPPFSPIFEAFGFDTVNVSTLADLELVAKAVANRQRPLMVHVSLDPLAAPS